ncbi:DUF1501 domain-containing protein [Zavarzinella formosa]|uniref:DUF1501 domain-containing protein n=1 Tax=Zavarzinella formosa TaxID=360055 RepID=UPI000372AE16|nr:DUF1501 domain-containing protein [Zavarzinella formosa]
MLFSPESNRRRFLTQVSSGIGYAALASLLTEQGHAAPSTEPVAVPGSLGKTHFPPKVKNVIYLFMAGGPSHVDLWDHKPRLKEMHGQDMPKSILGDQRVTLMTRNQGHFKTASTGYKWTKHGQSGLEVSEALPHLGKMADDLCLIRSIHSEPINHDPAVTFMQTGRPQPGLPCMGSWMSYGLGSVNKDLPAFTVMISGPMDQPIPSRYFHSGFLPSQHQGVQFLAGNDPVLYLSNPQGVSPETRGELVGGINELNRLRHGEVKDPEIEARIKSFELAFKMQSSVPELMDITKESAKTLELYGPEVKTPGSFARHCLLARRLVQRGTRFVQLFHRGWDQHGDVTGGVKRQAGATDQPAAALLQDLKNNGLLDETLVIWGGEFGRTAYGQGNLSGGFGRDHHPRCFSMWLAGGGVKKGTVIGKTDDFGYNVAERPVHVNDLHATILQLMGVDHKKLTFRFGGRDFRLTDVAGEVVKEALA